MITISVITLSDFHFTTSLLTSIVTSIVRGHPNNTGERGVAKVSPYSTLWGKGSLQKYHLRNVMVNFTRKGYKKPL
jgi:hypothetical protein